MDISDCVHDSRGSTIDDIWRCDDSYFRTVAISRDLESKCMLAPAKYLYTHFTI